MNRAQRRRQAKEQKRGEATYSVNKNGLRMLTHEVAEEQLAEARSEALNEALLLMLYFPMHVLLTDYWPKSFRQKIPGFMEKVLALYSDFQDDKISLDEIQTELWEVGGIRLQKGEDS